MNRQYGCSISPTKKITFTEDHNQNQQKKVPSSLENLGGHLKGI